jgi:hypothetical protein
MFRYSKLGFAGNSEPSFIIPTVVAVNESFLDQSEQCSSANWLAQYNAGVMADLDFFIGDEALSHFKSSGLYSLRSPIRHGQVCMYFLFCNLSFSYVLCDYVMPSPLLSRLMTGIQWKDFGSNPFSIIYGAILKNTTSFLQIVLSVHLKVVNVWEK